MKRRKLMNKETLLVVDGENLLHRSYHKFIKFKASDGTPTGAIYGFLKSLHSAIFRYNPTSVIITFDNGRSKHRTKILPGYKGSRKKLGMDYDSLQSQKKVIRKLLKYLCIPVIFDKPFKNEYESDDYIALITRLYPGKVMILSSDKDFDQLISKRVKIINPSKDSVISIYNCKAIKGYEPHECVDYLSLTGDTSDNIPGAKGIGPAKARILLDTHGSVRRYLDMDEEGVNKVLQNAYWMGQELIDLNYFLDAHPIDNKDIPIKYGKTINISKLGKYYNMYSLVSFKSAEFLNVFKKLKVWKIKK
jgi:DNA polymerase-1